jgi:CRISPR/Cas system-associated protein Csx1
MGEKTTIPVKCTDNARMRKLYIYMDAVLFFINGHLLDSEIDCKLSNKPNKLVNQKSLPQVIKFDASTGTFVKLKFLK